MQIPVALTRLIGRDQEQQAINTLLLQPDVRLVTLTGAGGIGKTRLALACAYDLQTCFAHGVCFVSLVSINDPAQLLPLIVQTLGLQEKNDQHLLETLKIFLQKRQLLLVLDNFEQIIEAAPLLTALLSSCPSLTILVTSREALQVEGEHRIAIPPLDLPAPLQEYDVEQLSHNAAITLFVEHAQARKLDFCLTAANASTIAEICIQLDGLPLALELAAAYVKLLTPQALLSRLSQRLELLTGGSKDRPAHQQTLRKTIQWSYDLLTASEQKLFRRLAIFVGGFCLHTVEGLYAALGETRADLLDDLTSLLNKSLIEQGAPSGNGSRLSMLETLREFGLEQLTANGERENCMAAHATYFHSYVNQANESRPVTFYDAPIEALSGEYSNIRTALQTMIDLGDLNAALRLACSLTSYWFLRGLLSEGRGFLEQLLKISTAQQSESRLQGILPVAYSSASWLAFWQNDLSRCKELAQASLDLFEARGSKHGKGFVLQLLGLVEMRRLGANYHAGDRMYKEGLAIFRELGDKGGLANSLLGLMINKLQLGELAEARTFGQESLALCQELAMPWSIAVNLHYLGWLCYLEGDAVTAIKHTEEGLRLLRKIEAHPFLDEALMVYALEQLAVGDERAAQASLEELVALAQRNGGDECAFNSYYGRGQLALHQGDLNQAATYFKKALLRIERSWYAERNPWWIPSCLEGLALVALQQRQPARATRLFSAADERRRGLGTYFTLGLERSRYEEALNTARTALGNAAFHAAWQQGRHLEPGQALAAQEPIAPADAPPLPLHNKKREALSPTALALGLTCREIDVLRLVALGLRNREIAQRLGLSVATVNAYLRSIYSKLSVTSRTSATRYALDHHLLS